MSKSVLDGVPVVETASYKEAFNKSKSVLSVVGNCPNCGAPVYGQHTIVSNPEVRYSCDCRLTVKNLEIKDTMKTT